MIEPFRELLSSGTIIFHCLQNSHAASMIFSASFNADLPRENKDALKKCMKNFKNLQFAVPTHNSCRLIMYATLSLMTASSSLAWACKN
jgi:hypothetical protein